MPCGLLRQTDEPLECRKPVFTRASSASVSDHGPALVAGVFRALPIRSGEVVERQRSQSARVSRRRQIEAGRKRSAARSAGCHRQRAVVEARRTRAGDPLALERIFQHTGADLANRVDGEITPARRFIEGQRGSPSTQTLCGRARFRFRRAAARRRAADLVDRETSPTVSPVRSAELRAEAAGGHPEHPGRDPHSRPAGHIEPSRRRPARRPLPPRARDARRQSEGLHSFVAFRPVLLPHLSVNAGERHEDGKDPPVPAGTLGPGRMTHCTNRVATKRPSAGSCPAEWPKSRRIASRNSCPSRPENRRTRDPRAVKISGAFDEPTCAPSSPRNLNRDAAPDDDRRTRHEMHGALFSNVDRRSAE